jgi:putative CocE/NonD family hydrolase
MQRSFPSRILVCLLVTLLLLLGTGMVLAPAAEAPQDRSEEEATSERISHYLAETPASTAAYEVERVREDWTMWDGITLPVSVYYPVIESPNQTFPVIIFIHGWGLDKSMSEWAVEYYASRGYIGIAVTTRGWFGAGGQVGCMHPDHDIKDISHIITLVEEDDRFPVMEDDLGAVVGITGASMGGCFSYMIAPRKNPREGDPCDPRVRAVVPMHGSFDLTFSLYPNDTVKFLWATLLFSMSYMGNFVGFFMDMLALSADERMDGMEKMYAIIDAMWDLIPPLTEVTEDLPYIYWTAIERRIEEKEEALQLFKIRSARYWCDEEYDGVVEHPISAPILILAGWNDDLFYANEGLMAFNHTEAPKRIIVTNHGHAGCYPGPYPAGIPVSEESQWIMDQVDAWFDRYLKGMENGVEVEPRVAFYRDRDPDNFGMADDYPLPGTQEVSLYMGDGSGGKADLSTEAGGWFSWPDIMFNIGLSGSISLPYFNDAGSLMGGGEPMDYPTRIKLIEVPFTECSFITDPLAEDMTIMGPPLLELYYQSLRPFAQMIPFLYEVTPEGEEILISRGYFEGYNESTWTLTDTKDRRIEMQANYHRFPAGSRIKLDFTTADLPMAWPCWEFNAILLHHNSNAPSRIILPVVPNNN